jgi:hypothetical protein
VRAVVDPIEDRHRGRRETDPVAESARVVENRFHDSGPLVTAQGPPVTVTIPMGAAVTSPRSLRRMAKSALPARIRPDSYTALSRPIPER